MDTDELAGYAARHGNVVRDPSLTMQRQQTFEERCALLENAWRQSPDAAPPKTSTPPPQSIADAQRLREQAHRAYCERLLNAWRTP
jgi:hypothetical protein